MVTVKIAPRRAIFAQECGQDQFFDLHSQALATMFLVCSAARGWFSISNPVPAALLGRFLPNLGPCTNTAPFFASAAKGPFGGPLFPDYRNFTRRGKASTGLRAAQHGKATQERGGNIIAVMTSKAPLAAAPMQRQPCSGLGKRCVAFAQRALHEDGVEPAAELEADRGEGAGPVEAQGLVQADRASVLRVADHRDHLPVA